MKSVRNIFSLSLFIFVLSSSLQLQAETVWTDASVLGIEGKGWEETEDLYDRLPASAKGLVPNSVWYLSKQSSGLRVRFKSTSQRIALRWGLTSNRLSMPHMPVTGVSGIDLYQKNKKGRWVFVRNARPNRLNSSVSINTENNKKKEDKEDKEDKEEEEDDDDDDEDDDEEEDDQIQYDEEDIESLNK